VRIRSGYSFSTAAGHLPDVMSRIQEIGWDVAPISDRASTFAFARWTKAARKTGLRPIYGVELAVVTNPGEKKLTADYWTFFAKDDVRSLHNLIYRATHNIGSEPNLTYAQALSEPGVIIIAGERLQFDHLPTDPGPDFFVALSPATPKGLIKRCLDQNLKLIASGDNYYPRPTDLEFYRVLLGRRSGTQTYPRHILSDDEWRGWFAPLGLSEEVLIDALTHRQMAMERCTATLNKAKLLTPEKPKTLREMCEDGARTLGVDLTDRVYSDRLDRELSVIAEKEFEDYFYIVSSMVAWARQRMVVGPARGSSCGSLVCYLTGITTVDPIPYGLLFERFIDLNRRDLPDIDIDFSDTRRHLVFEYAEKTYGRERVARLGTVGMFKAKSALNQAGSSLLVPSWETDKVGEMLTALNKMEESDSGKKLLEKYPEMLVAKHLEDHPNVASQHAAGLLITDKPIAQYVALDARTRAAWCDKEDSEELNLLKIDALGLTQLSIFERCLELMGERPTSHFLDAIPLDDPAAFAVLNEGHFSGIFQFAGSALRGLATQVKTESIDDIIAMTALARPGPMASGGTASWVKRKRGEEEATTLHPLLTELTRETLGVIVYQETVMQVVRQLGKMSWEDTSAIRKAMSASQGDEVFDGYWLKFKAGAVENGMDPVIAKIIWEQMRSFGAYAFNKAHAAAYGIVSYWCCWLKAHHPLPFAAATLDAEGDANKQLAILRELDREGTRYIPVDPERSTDRWTIAERNGETVLVGPLTAIKGFGPAKVLEILDCRSHGKPLKPSIAKQLASAKTEIDTLYPIRAAINRLWPDLSKANVFTQPTDAISAQPGVNGDIVVIGVLKRISVKNENDEANVIKRNGRKVYGPDKSLNLFLVDDTDEVFCKINRYDFERMGKPVLDKARLNKTIYAIKGNIPPDFRMVSVKAIKALGEIDQ